MRKYCISCCILEFIANNKECMFHVVFVWLVRDKFGQPPYTSAKDKECRNEFRKFMGQYPDRYDYKTAQVLCVLS